MRTNIAKNFLDETGSKEAMIASIVDIGVVVAHNGFADGFDNGDDDENEWMVVVTEQELTIRSGNGLVMFAQSRTDQNIRPPLHTAYIALSY